MVGTEKIDLEGKPASSIDEKLRMIYNSQPFLQDQTCQALIRECKQLCKGDFVKYRRVLQDRYDATQQKAYQRQMFIVEDLEQFERALKNQLAQRSITGIDLAYIIERFGDNISEEETQREGAPAHGPQTKVIRFYLGTPPDRETG